MKLEFSDGEFTALVSTLIEGIKTCQSLEHKNRMERDKVQNELEMKKQETSHTQNVERMRLDAELEIKKQEARNKPYNKVG